MKTYLLAVRYRPATDTNGARFVVKPTKGDSPRRQSVAYNYSADNAAQAAARVVAGPEADLVEWAGDVGDWSLFQVTQKPGPTVDELLTLLG